MMNDAMRHDMTTATSLTRAGRLTEATTMLQAMLGGTQPAGTATQAAGGASGATGRPTFKVIDGVAETVDGAGDRSSAQASASSREGLQSPMEFRLPEALRGFLDKIRRVGRGGVPGAETPSPAGQPGGARFVDGSFTNASGTRPYKLYIPASGGGRALPLVVMLHGCTQSPDDFAAGTRMNALAEEHGCLVVYPAQVASANVSRCWNWFEPKDQTRDRGEPSLIAGIARQIMREHAVDPARIYVAGLSAGGAAAAIMARTHPDLFAAAGVHSGLACGAARDMASALAAMRQGAEPAAILPPTERIVPTIVFHGDGDTTVNPRNAGQVIAQAAAATTLAPTVEQGRVPGGRAWTRTVYSNRDGRPVEEQWVVHGAGHAWSGGSTAGSYTDPQGPDASREMLRFFLAHPQPPAGA